MARTAENEALNQVLIDLDKSLLSYAAEAWPWTAREDAPERARVQELFARRRAHVAALCDLLVRRGWNVEFGTYPTEFTDLHYVALDFLLAQLIDHQRQLLRGIEQTQRAVAGDDEAAALLGTLLGEERAALAALEELARAHSPVGAK